jgi:hypothetical protein
MTGCVAIGIIDGVAIGIIGCMAIGIIMGIGVTGMLVVISAGCGIATGRMIGIGRRITSNINPIRVRCVTWVVIMGWFGSPGARVGGGAGGAHGAGGGQGGCGF